MSNAKRTLKKFYYLQLSIRSKRRKIAELHELAISVGSFIYDTEKVRGSKESAAPYEDKIAAVVELEKKLAADIKRMTLQMDKVQEIIEQVPRDKERLVLQLRYIECMKFEDIAKEMNYSVDYIYELHRQAMRNI